MCRHPGLPLWVPVAVCRCVCTPYVYVCLYGLHVCKVLPGMQVRCGSFPCWKCKRCAPCRPPVAVVETSGPQGTRVPEARRRTGSSIRPRRALYVHMSSRGSPLQPPRRIRYLSSNTGLALHGLPDRDVWEGYREEQWHGRGPRSSQAPSTTCECSCDLEGQWSFEAEASQTPLGKAALPQPHRP